MEQPRQDELEAEVLEIKLEIKDLKASLVKWEAKAEAAEKEGKEEDKSYFRKQLDSVNTQLVSLQGQLTSLQQRLLLKEQALEADRHRNDALVASVSQLSLEQPQCIRVGWGDPIGASNFVASKQSKSLGVVLCLCAAPFWSALGDPSAAQVGAADVDRVFGALLGCETYWSTKVEKIPETAGPATVDGLMGNALRRVFSGSVFTCAQDAQQMTMEQLCCGTGPTSGTSRPDFTVRVGSLVVFIAEFKDTVTAPIEQLIQAAAEGCNAVIAQYCAGMAVAKCRCELLLTNGHLFQFAVVTLLPPCMPRVVLTSRVLDHSWHEDAIAISQRLAAVVEACAVLRPGGEERPPVEEFLLDAKAYHEKPAAKWLLQEESPRCSERAFLRVFEKLWQCEALREHAVFPVGFLSDGGELRSILFEKLNTDWKIGMPAAGNEFTHWQEQLRQILVMMHSCNVVHMDLMPCNIAWKRIDGGVLVKLLDFDAATSLPFRVGSKLQDLSLTNRKGFMWQEALVPNVRFDWWMWFLYDEMPEKCRVSAPVSDHDSPASVNGPFLEWLKVQDIARLRNSFNKDFVVEQELGTESEL
jgi:hypothetical protein